MTKVMIGRLCAKLPFGINNNPSCNWDNFACKVLYSGDNP